MKVCNHINLPCPDVTLAGLAIALVCTVGAIGCGDHEPTAVRTPVRVLTNDDSRAVVTREGKRLRITMKERTRIAPFVMKPAWEKVVYERGRPPAGRIATQVTTSARALPGTDVTLNVVGPDTAIVRVSGGGTLETGSSRFTLAANLSATVVQGSWYPLQRAANGYQLIVSLPTNDGLRRLGTRESCMVTTLWNVPAQQCMHLLSMINTSAVQFSTGTEVDVGSACAYFGELNTKGTVSWHHNFNTDVNAREPRETQVFDSKQAMITRKCFPDPADFCIDQSLCEPEGDDGDSWIGQSASVEGQVEWISPFTSSGASREVVVCEVTDWYQLAGTQWVYVDTTVESCWLEPR